MQFNANSRPVAQPTAREVGVKLLVTGTTYQVVPVPKSLVTCVIVVDIVNLLLVSFSYIGVKVRLVLKDDVLVFTKLSSLLHTRLADVDRVTCVYLCLSEVRDGLGSKLQILD